MSRKTKQCGMYKNWTDAKFWAFIRSGLRAKWVRWPCRFEAIKAARKNVTGKRHKYEHQCAICKDWFLQKNIQVDHITPVGTLKDYKHLPAFVKRLFVSTDKLRVVCKACHLGITKKYKNENT